MHFLEKVDTYVLDKLNLGDTKETLLAEHALFQEFVYLETFRKELSQFLGMQALPTSICDEDARWFSFLAAYAGVIEDGSLTCQSKGPDKLKIVERVTFTKGARDTADGHVPFDMKWDILLKDKRRVEIEVGTQPNCKLMHSRLHLVTA